MKKNFIKTAKDVINLEISGLIKLKKSLNSSFNQAVKEIAKCQSKVILCGVGNNISTSKIGFIFWFANSVFRALDKPLAIIKPQ